MGLPQLSVGAPLALIPKPKPRTPPWHGVGELGFRRPAPCSLLGSQPCCCCCCCAQRGTACMQLFLQLRHAGAASVLPCCKRLLHVWHGLALSAAPCCFAFSLPWHSIRVCWLSHCCACHSRYCCWVLLALSASVACTSRQALRSCLTHAGARKPWLDVEGQVHLPLMFVYPETLQVSRSCRSSCRVTAVFVAPG